MADASSWTEPGAHRVHEGVFRIPLPLPQDGLRAVNVYALESDSGLVLIDSGWALDESLSQLGSSLRDIGYSLHDVCDFLVTHAHRDHYTQAVSVRRLAGSRISLGVGERPAMEAINTPGARGLSAQRKQLAFAGGHEVVRLLDAQGYGRDLVVDEWEFPDKWIQDGQEMRVSTNTLIAIQTPGHTPGHMVFADLSRKLLFAGDHVLPHITPSIGFTLTPDRLPLRDYLESLARVRALPDLLLLPAHGPITSSVHQRIDELTLHHEDRLLECLDAVTGGAHTAYSVAGILGWTRRRVPLLALNAMNQMLAVTETLAHLDLLAAQSRLIHEVGDDGVVWFSLPS